MNRMCVLLVALVAAVLLLAVVMTVDRLDQLERRPPIVQQDVFIDGVPIPTAPPREPMTA